MMRILLAALVILTTPAIAQEPSVAPRAGASEGRRIDRQDDQKAEIARYLEWLSCEDKELRDFAARKLVEAGKNAVPQLEKLLAAKGAVEIYRILKEIEVPKFNAARSWAEPELVEFDLKKDLPKVDRREVEKYVYSKLAEATALYKQKMYERAYNVAKAMLLLEPTSVYAAKLQELARVCDNMVAQTSLLRTTVVSKAHAFSVGCKAELMLKMENVFKNKISLAFGGGQAKNGLIVVEIMCDNLDPASGSTTLWNRSEELLIETSIDIAMSGQWERTFTVDTGLDFEKDQENLRHYTVGAWCQPGKVDVGFGNQARRLIFMPVHFWAVPKKYEHIIEDPLASFRKSVKAGTTSEVFISAMLSPPDGRDEVVETLIGMMELSNTVTFRALAGSMLGFITEQRLGDNPKTWREWQEKSKGPKPPPKK